MRPSFDGRHRRYAGRMPNPVVLSVDTRKVADDFMGLLERRLAPIAPAGAVLVPVQTRAWTRVFPDMREPIPFLSSKMTADDLSDWMADLPVHVVEPRKQRHSGPREWDDCDDCADLFHAAEDVNREAEMTAEESAANWRTNFEAYGAALLKALR